MAKNICFTAAIVFWSFYFAGAQCTASVSIVAGSTANAPALSCQAVMDTFWAIPVNGGSAPAFKWYVGNNPTPVITTDSFLVSPVYVGSNMFRPAINVSVSMTANDGCAVGTQYAYYNLAILPLPENVSITETTTQYNNDSALITYYISSYNVDSIYANIYPAAAAIAVKPRGTAQHPALDTIAVVWRAGWQQVTSVFNCVDTFAGCNFYCFGDTLNAFSDSAGINQPLCIVNLDTTTNKPLVIWQKTNKNATGAYYLFRANGPFNANASFNLAGIVNRDSLSAWEDTSAYPQSGSYGYRIEARDTNGIFSAPSASHWTLYLTAQGDSFSWTPYIISDDTLPVGSYSFYRDAMGNGNWQLLINVPDTQTTVTDTGYASYPNARYMVVLTLTNPCTPSREVTTITSNILLHANPASVQQLPAGQIKVSPNPVHDNLMVSASDAGMPALLTVTNILAQTVYTCAISTGTIQIDTQNWQDGIYFITVSSAKSRITFKVVKS